MEVGELGGGEGGGAAQEEECGYGVVFGGREAEGCVFGGWGAGPEGWKEPHVPEDAEVVFAVCEGAHEVSAADGAEAVFVVGECVGGVGFLGRGG